jgi:ribosome maturation factor RimP
MPIGNQRNFTGQLMGLRDGQVVVESDKGELLLPLDEIDKARLVPKF